MSEKKNFLIRKHWFLFLFLPLLILALTVTMAAGPSPTTPIKYVVIIYQREQLL